MSRWFGFIGALFGLAALVLAALAMHALAAELAAHDLQRVALAAAFLALHALLLLHLATLARQTGGLLLAIAGWLVVFGVLGFCGSLLGAALFAWPVRLAPYGGAALIAGWLALAVWFLGAPSRS
jgi:uncharacterized membrane protein YgdD (TMEM256/DUF423 family)